MTDVKLLLLHSHVWNHLTVFPKRISSGSLKNVINKIETKRNLSTSEQNMYTYISINRIWR